MGKLLPIEYIVFGSVGKVGQTYTMSVILANVESGEMEKSATHDMKGEIDGLLTTGMAAAARRLLGLEAAEPVAVPTSAPVMRADPASPAGESPRGAGRQGQPMSVDIGGGVKMEFVWIPALKMWVGKYEVTNEEHRRYKSDHNRWESKGHSLNGDRQPVVMVNFDDAKAYAEWINRTYSGQLPAGYKVRLPSEDEWMVFAQCGDGREYPWGNEWPPESGQAGNYCGQETRGIAGSMIDSYSDGYPVTCDVEQSWGNPWGIYGVGGNVWECTASGAVGASFGAWRGASWRDYYQDFLRCSSRDFYGGAFRIYRYGFRLVLSR